MAGASIPFDRSLHHGSFSRTSRLFIGINGIGWLQGPCPSLLAFGGGHSNPAQRNLSSPYSRAEFLSSCPGARKAGCSSAPWGTARFVAISGPTAVDRKRPLCRRAEAAVARLRSVDWPGRRARAGLAAERRERAWVALEHRERTPECRWRHRRPLTRHGGSGRGLYWLSYRQWAWFCQSRWR